MSGNIARLPTAAVSYYTVHKRGKGWAVVLVIPCPGMRSLKTAIYHYGDRAAAVDQAQKLAAQMQRPFKEGKA